MSAGRSGALVFYGATGDLAFKKIFPALCRMVQRGQLDVPVIGVAFEDWSLERFQARARDSLEQHGGAPDPDATDRLRRLLRYVPGDYTDPATFDAVYRELGDAQRPVHYLAVPQAVFEVVIDQLGRSGCARDARLVLEKPFGTDLDSARHLNAVLHKQVDETAFLFAHGHLLRLLAARWLGWPPDAGGALSLDAASVCVLATERERPVLRHWNEICHVEGER